MKSRKDYAYEIECLDRSRELSGKRRFVFSVAIKTLSLIMALITLYFLFIK